MGIQAQRSITAKSRPTQCGVGSILAMVDEQPRAQTIRTVLKWLMLAFMAVRDESITASKGSSRSSSCWHFETPGAVDDQTTHNMPDLLASTQTEIWNPV
ncbi:hypothetical protein RHMOL_Rhmol10G0251200 [Rhododendron molle]|uniref:Uncharacterized protein n=1 Tax=Rhododendron molle TaxID=49168 RepID=A0ACC0M7H6_RHOML|nr:hypothetical protein RHMOL_Rhmol10G0251200 [Rhododendron molle]